MPIQFLFNFTDSNVEKSVPLLSRLKSSIFLITLTTLTACQSMPINTNPVLQRANKVYETTGYGATKVAAKQSALFSANETCKSLSPIIVNDEMIYNGVMSEQMSRMVSQATTVAGAILGTSPPDLSRDDDYEYTISFKCQ